MYLFDSQPVERKLVSEVFYPMLKTNLLQNGTENISYAFIFYKFHLFYSSQY